MALVLEVLGEARGIGPQVRPGYSPLLRGPLQARERGIVDVEELTTIATFVPSGDTAMACPTASALATHGKARQSWRRGRRTEVAAGQQLTGSPCIVAIHGVCADWSGGSGGNTHTPAWSGPVP